MHTKTRVRLPAASDRARAAGWTDAAVADDDDGDDDDDRSGGRDDRRPGGVVAGCSRCFVKRSMSTMMTTTTIEPCFHRLFRLCPSGCWTTTTRSGRSVSRFVKVISFFLQQQKKTCHILFAVLLNSHFKFLSLEFLRN